MHEQSRTQLLIRQWQSGDEDPRGELIEHLYPELAQVAAARLRRESNSSLSTGDLINDAIVRLIHAGHIEVTDRAHFIALASRLMRNILVDHARAKHSAKRDHVKVELCTQVEGDRRFDLTSLETALVRLGAIDRQLMELVEMRYFGGMTIDDISVVTQLSEATVKRRWQVARAWLMDALANDIDNV